MTLHGRRAGFALLLFILLAIPLFAQDAGPLKVVGSSAAGTLFKAGIEASGVEVALEYDFAGTQGGVTAFCQNQAGVVVTSRALTTSEVAACSANSVQYHEVLFGLDGYALIASPDVTFLDCITNSELNLVIAPSAIAEDTTWSIVNTTYPALPFGFVAMQAGTRAYDLLDGVINGDGFRSDAGLTPNFEPILTTVADGSGNLGLVPLSAALNATENIKVLELSNGELGKCFPASAANVLNRSYVGGERLFAYVNSAQLTATTGLKDALTAILSAEGQTALGAAGAVALTEDALAESLAVVNDGTTGRVFSVDLDLFQPVPNTSGELRVGGNSSAASFVKASMTSFTQRNPGVTLTESYLGAAAAARELCSGNLDIAVVSAALTEEEAAACAASEITVVQYDLGVQSAVLLANSANTDLACLTTEQLKTVWTASAEAPTTWDAAGVGTESSEIILFALSKGDAALNLLVNTVNGVASAAREDVNVNADVLYIGAALNNVPSGLAVVTLAQAEQLIAEGYAVQLVGLNSGSECVVPSAATLADGSYSVAQPVTVLANQASLATDHVQAALWNILANSNYSNIDSAGLSGLSIDTLIAKRQALQALFAEADLIEAEKFAADTAATATAVVEATMTPGQTLVPTLDPNVPTLDPNATVVPTVEPTTEVAATVEPTLEPTSEVAATVEPTAEPTTETAATVEPTVAATTAP